MPAIYRGAEVFAFPSEYEGFGFPVLEAMACGTPVVASDASSIPEVVGDAGVLVPPRDVGALAAALEGLLKYPGRATHLRARGLARARLFSWSKTVDRTVREYQWALKEIRRPRL